MLPGKVPQGMKVFNESITLRIRKLVVVRQMTVGKETGYNSSSLRTEGAVESITKAAHIQWAFDARLHKKASIGKLRELPKTSIIGWAKVTHPCVYMPLNANAHGAKMLKENFWTLFNGYKGSSDGVCLGLTHGEFLLWS